MILAKSCPCYPHTKVGSGVSQNSEKLNDLAKIWAWKSSSPDHLIHSDQILKSGPRSHIKEDQNVDQTHTDTSTSNGPDLIWCVCTGVYRHPPRFKQLHFVHKKVLGGFQRCQQLPRCSPQALLTLDQFCHFWSHIWSFFISESSRQVRMCAFCGFNHSNDTTIMKQLSAHSVQGNAVWYSVPVVTWSAMPVVRHTHCQCEACCICMMSQLQRTWTSSWKPEEQKRKLVEPLLAAAERSSSSWHIVWSYAWGWLSEASCQLELKLKFTAGTLTELQNKLYSSSNVVDSQTIHNHHLPCSTVLKLAWRI